MDAKPETANAQKPHAPLEHYASLAGELEDLGRDELVERATAAGVDGADAMSEAQLLEKLKDEPGANEA